MHFETLICCPPADGSWLPWQTGKKHGAQQISIASHLRRQGLLEARFCYVEFGAGKGGLSHTLAAATSDTAAHILIDRGNPRMKDDRHHRRPGYTRHRVDIAHLALSGLQPQIAGKPVVGVGKHLCGAATDLSLRCLAHPA